MGFGGHVYRRGETIHGLYAWHARRTPGTIALVHGRREVDYATLDALASGYAGELETLGVGPGQLVAVLLPRSIEMIAVLLAILRRGAAYAALDPRWPRRRLDALVRQLDGAVLVTDDESWTVPRWCPSTTPVSARPPTPVPVGGPDPAMVFFTSGSTGIPKGVVLPHHGTVRLFDACDFQPFGPGVIQAQTMPLHWDGSILDLWSALLCGGTSILIDDVMQPDLLRRVIRDHGVNAAGFLPGALFNVIVDEDIDAFAGLRFLGIGGERLSPGHVARFLDRHRDIELTNIYGPVESTALVTAHRITAADVTTADVTTADVATADGAGIPIGRPVTASAVYVLDGARLCAPGETGELCLAGDGLAIGYLGNADLTARRFTDVTVAGGPVRVYRTGDLGRMTAGGLFHHLGRDDRQVKISGHRIEPGEVEHTAEQVPGVRRSAAVPVPGPDGEPRALALFYVCDPARPVDPERLRAALAERLPGYLLPRDVRRLDTLPLTATGKLDRRALDALVDVASASVNGGSSGPGPAEDGSSPDGLPGSDGASSDTAGLIATAFRQVLAVPRVTDTDSFLDLGGTSLDAARLCTRLATALGASIPVSQVYRTPTVAGLSGWLAALADDESTPVVDAAAIPLGVGPTNYIGATAGTICVLDWWIRGDLDVDALHAALDDVHHRHQGLHVHYRHTDPPTARVPARIRPVELRLLPLAEDGVAMASAVYAAVQEPLHVDRGEVWRAVLGEATPGGRRLLGIGVHHIAFDAWSSDLLVADLSVAYAARAAGRVPHWDRPAPGLADLATESGRRSRPVDLAAQREYWQRQLRTLPRFALPGLPRGALPPTGPTEGRRFTITETELSAWDSRARACGTNRFACLLAVFGAVLYELTGRRDAGVLVPVAMRGSPVADAAITCRINPVILRLTGPVASGGDPLGLDGDPLALNSAPIALDGDPLGRVSQTINEALAAQDLPFGAVVAAVAQVRPDIHALLNLPIFLVQDRASAHLKLAGCQVEPIEDRQAQDIPSPLAVELVLTDTGANLNVGVRTDLVPLSLADTIGEAYLRILRAGPGRIHCRT